MRTGQLFIALTLALSFIGAGQVWASEPEVIAQAEQPSQGKSAETAEPAKEPGEAKSEAETPPAPAQPKPGIEEIVIRGGESEAVSDYQAADSVTGFDASDLAALGAQSVEDLAGYTPNLEIVTSGATTPTFFIRGVGLNDFNANSTGAVAIYQDDVPINSPALQLGTLYDMEAVNVLRGPQGTGLARNASAGAIKLYTRKPSGEYGSTLQASYGNYDYMDFQGALEAPIYEDMLSTRLAFRWTQRDGYGKNGCAGEPGPNGKRCGEQFAGTVPDGLPAHINNLANWAARGTLRFQPTLDMDWLLGFHGGKRDEQSRLGQTVGTGGNTCIPFGPDEQASDFDGNQLCWYGDPVTPTRGKKSDYSFGGADVLTYKDKDVTAMFNKLKGLDANNPLNPPVCASLPNGSNPGQKANCRNVVSNTALLQLGKQLADQPGDDHPYRGDYNLVGPTKNDVWGTYLRGELALPKGITLTTTSSYDEYDRFINVDLDQSPDILFQILTDDSGWQATQNLDITGQFSEQLPLRWEVGGWLLREQIHVHIDNTLPPPDIGTVAERDYTQDIWSAAGFANLVWDIDPRFTLDGGFRWNFEQKSIDYFLARTAVPYTAVDKKTWQAPTGLVRLTYKFREDTQAYWKYTRGWKPGHYNATASLFTGLDVAKPETLDAFETGLRGSWFEGRLGLDASIFYYNYRDYQLFTVKTDAGESPEFVIINASNAEVYGSEVDLVARPFPGTFLNVRFSWLESQFIDFTQTQFIKKNIDVFNSITIAKEIDNTGNPLLNSPQFKVSITAEQSIPLGRFGTLTARYDGAWTDTTYFDATAGQGIPNNQGEIWMPKNAIGQPSYWLHNVWLGYRPPVGNVEISAWMRNVSNQVYRTFAFDASNFTNTTIHLFGTPRTYGLTFSVGF